LDILDKFKKQSNFGEHSMLIYPDRYALREIYSRACKIALENNEAIIMLLHYETREDVLTYLKELDINVYNFEKKERTLLIIDSAKDYFGSAKDFLFYLNLMNANASRRNKRGILVLMDIGFHYYHHRIIRENLSQGVVKKFKIAIAYSSCISRINTTQFTIFLLP
jgi:hypothetical protein